MNEKKILKNLIYCYNCFSESSTYYISNCMHLICIICIKKNFKICPICKNKVEFKIFNEKLENQFLNNPYDNLNKPMEILMFQLNSAMNLILHLKDQNETYKNLLCRMKEQLIISKNKNIKQEFRNKKNFDYNENNDSLNNLNIGKYLKNDYNNYIENNNYNKNYQEGNYKNKFSEDFNIYRYRRLELNDNNNDRNMNDNSDKNGRKSQISEINSKIILKNNEKRFFNNESKLINVNLDNKYSNKDDRSSCSFNRISIPMKKNSKRKKYFDS